MTPDSVLDLNIGQVQAFIEGSEEAQFFQRTLLVEQANWNRVFKQKHPKSVSEYVRKMRQEFDKSSNGVTQKHQNDVDVAAFQRLEQQRLQAMQNKE